jgi:malate dehydrogenase (oxaloacetate-decarboxylating)(NADP+)
MHDDQHGTAIISSAALLNALELAEKKIEDVKVVVSGAGAAAISCIRLYSALGVAPEHILMVDSKGVISTSRTDLDDIKREFARETKAKNLADAMVGADVFLGLSVGNIVTPKMLNSMAENPIVFACANPDPEIAYDVAVATRKDIIMATGRSDFPNQVNNVLGFPFIFRGALDVRATSINEEMKLAAVKALADLAKEPVPVEVTIAYGESNFTFGKEYIIPKPLDHRLITTVAPAVAKAAIASGVSQREITDWEAYATSLDERMGLDNKLVQSITQKARKSPKRVVFAEADHYKILKAAQIVRDDGIAIPILLGNKKTIKALIDEHGLELNDIEIIDSREEKERERRERYAQALYNNRMRRGFTPSEARKIMHERNYFGAAMVQHGDADAMISGLTRNYPATIKPALQVIGTDPAVRKIAGMYVIITKQGPLFLADTTINYNPTAEELVDITVLVHEAVERFRLKPRIALLSYSNFGSSDGEEAIKVRNAVRILHDRYPNMVVDGDIQANFAINPELISDSFPFSKLAGRRANVLIFPNLSAGNITYKLLQEMGDRDAIGPILLGMNKPVHILQLGSSVREIVNMVTISVVDAQTRTKTGK